VHGEGAMDIGSNVVKVGRNRLRMKDHGSEHVGGRRVVHA